MRSQMRKLINSNADSNGILGKSNRGLEVY